MKQSTTKLGVHWPRYGFKYKALGPLLRVKILLLTQNVQLRVRTSIGLEKARAEILSQNCTLLHEFNTRRSGKIAMRNKGNIIGINLTLCIYLSLLTIDVIVRARMALWIQHNEEYFGSSRNLYSQSKV